MEYPSTYLLKATPDDLQKLADLAAKDGVSMAEWIRNAIRDAWEPWYTRTEAKQEA